MRPVLLSALAAVALVPAASATPGRTAVAPALRLADTAPLTMRGLHFRPNERVTVVAFAGGRFSKALYASAAGRFLVQFRGADTGVCNGFAVTATGSMGSRARYKAPPRLCPPPLIPPGD